MRVRGLMWAVLLAMGFSTGAAARAENNSCGEPPDASHYVFQQGDTEDAQHFAAERSFNGRGQVEVNVCAGELRVERGHGDTLRLRIETEGKPALKMRAYVKTLAVAEGSATISLQFPHRLHAVVVLELPATAGLKTEVNLGAGKLEFDGSAIQGDRELNLGAGDAELSLNGDHNYAQMEVNVGMGSFHDHRPGGGSSHFIISRSYEGKGAGSLEVNVGAGSLDIEPAKGETI